MNYAHSLSETDSVPSITKVLIANRGEVAVRVIRTAREMGIATAAVYSDQDIHSFHCELADEALALGSSLAAESYLSPQALLAAAQRCGADAIHPGYGFLSENADFAQAVQDAGITWLGPVAPTIRALGDKISARQIAQSVQVPVIPGEELVQDIAGAQAQVLEFAQQAGYPILVKRADAGGGRGITRMDSAEDVSRFIQDLAGVEALAGCFVEKMVLQARHVETQCARDSAGNFQVVTTRDCSVQRRNQKVVEEAPAPHLPAGVEENLLAYSQALFAAADYLGVGTCEFLVSSQGEVYFLEVNPRLQVEHTVSEEVAGIDLVREQIRIARGENLTTLPAPRGHSFDVRITSENPADDLMPATGTIEHINWPGGPGVRIDTFVRDGDEIGADFDSLIAKLIVTAPTRAQALVKLLCAIGEFSVEGLPTSTPLLTHILNHPNFVGPDATVAEQAGQFAVYTKWMEDIGILEQVKSQLDDVAPPSQRGTSAASPAVASDKTMESFVVELDGRRTTLKLPSGMLARPAAEPVATTGTPARRQVLRGRGRRRSESSATSNSPNITAPIQATVVRTACEEGQQLEKGDLVVVLESMKMEKPIFAQVSCTVTKIHVTAGDSVKAGDLLADIAPNDEQTAQEEK